MLNEKKQESINELLQRVEDKILNKANADFLIKLINKAEDIEEVQAIMAIGNTYKRTGFHFDFRKEPDCSNIKYLKKNKELSFTIDLKATTHKLIIGDNYDSLKQLLITHRGLIDVIYIDPPYGKDSLGNFADTNYTNAITRDNLLSMLYVRLQLAKQLLSENGVLFCSIDEKNNAYLRCLCNDIFNEYNVDELIWQKMDPKTDRNTNAKIIHRFKSIHESIIVCYKDKSSTIFDKIMRLPEWKNEQTNPDNDPRGPWSSGIISFEEGHAKEDKSSENYYSIITPSGKEYTRHWFVSKEEFQRLREDNRISFPKNGDGVPRLKTFQHEEKEYYMESILRGFGTSSSAKDEILSIFSDRNAFDTPKPVKLLVELFRATSNKDSIILDFFAGSGTTGQAVLELNQEDGGNRTFILCTNNEVTTLTPNGIAYDITSKRLKRTMTGECYDGTSDFEWIKNNSPYGDNLEVTEITEISPTINSKGQTPFDVIDEQLYGLSSFDNKEDKINWVCTYFKSTMKNIESNKKYCERWGE